MAAHPRKFCASEIAPSRSIHIRSAPFFSTLERMGSRLCKPELTALLSLLALGILRSRAKPCSFATSVLLRDTRVPTCEVHSAGVVRGTCFSMRPWHVRYSRCILALWRRKPRICFMESALRYVKSVLEKIKGKQKRAGGGCRTCNTGGTALVANDRRFLAPASGLIDRFVCELRRLDFREVGNTLTNWTAYIAVFGVLRYTFAYLATSSTLTVTVPSVRARGFTEAA